MTDAEHGISVALLRPLSELLGRLDVAPASFLAAVGVAPSMAPNDYIPAARVDAELAAIAERRNDPAFAMTLARTSAIRPLGLFGHMVWLSGTVRDALTRAVKFYAMVTRRTEITLDERGDIATIRQRPVVPGTPRGRILTEFPFASLALRGREATGGAFTVRAVRFAHPGEPSEAYRDVFRAPVTFGARLDEIEIDAAGLDLKLASADPITSAALEAKIAQLAVPPRDPAIDRVRRAAAECLDDPSLAAIGKRLGISARTLRRQLEDHQATLREIVDEVRRERADELLARGVALKEIAFELGFSEPSAFSRAYKRWTGKSPAQD